MRKFELFRYLKKFSALIFVVALLGSAFIYYYAKSNQRYTATVVIKYTNSEIADGYTPDGTELDVNEIYSSSVISQAMELLGNDGPINMIRSRCSVEEVLSDEQKSLNEALIDKGEETTYFPDTYKVNLVVNGSYGADYARNALDAIMQSYCTVYTENYVEQKLSLKPSDNLIESGYDYYECITILENDTNDMLAFLKAKKDDYPDFRSSKTGYSYADLYNIYAQFKSYVIPELYARVLDGPQVRDGEILRKFLSNSIANSDQQESTQTERRDYINSLIEKYVEKNRGIEGRYYTEDGENISPSYILKDIDRIGAGSKSETTYDNLILEMVDIDKLIAGEKIERDFLKEISESFGETGSGSSGTEQSHKELEELIGGYENQLEEYYSVVSETGKELNLSISADYLKMISSVRVYPSVNVNLYLMLAVILFLLVGCIGAVVLGRLSDVVDYLLYTDKKSGLPNRDKLNIYIDSLSKRILPEDFTCFSIQLDNLSTITKRYGYTVGDGMLRDFSGLVSLMGDTEGVVGYNGIGKYVAFFEQCSSKKAAAILKVLSQQVSEYNAVNPEYPIKFTAAYETSSDNGIYQVRDLLRRSQALLTTKETSSASRAASDKSDDKKSLTEEKKDAE